MKKGPLVVFRVNVGDEVLPKLYVDYKKNRWWFQIFFMFTPNLGEMIHFDYVSNEL